jgi:CRISPR-associated exonuclease Cas4
MLAVSIACGALFYGKSQRRYDVTFDETLRCETADAARRLHELVRAGETPRAEYQKKCAKCSLIDLCMPKATSARQKAGRYLDNIIAETKGGDA